MKNETLDFAVYLTGHDKATIEQMYDDWKRGTLKVRSVCKCKNYTLREIFYLKMNVDKCPRCGLQN